MRSYLELLHKIIEEGEDRPDRTGVGTRSVFGEQWRIDLQEGFPLLTTKKMFWRGIVEELLFFVRGDTNTHLLSDKKINIWKGNTTRDFLDKRGLPYPAGEMGPGYGFQWRNWGGSYECDVQEDEESKRIITKKDDGIDQLAQVIHSLRHNPTDRRMLVSAWNPTQLSRMALPPCHLLYQFYVSKGRLSCQFYMRSIDVALGLPFNIASYALLTHLIAEITDLEPGELIFVGGDTHLYLNHLDGMQEQLQRKPYARPTLKIHKELRELEDIEAMTFKDLELDGYECHPAIKMPMAV